MGPGAVTLRWGRSSVSGIVKWQFQRDDDGSWIDVVGGASAVSVTDTTVESQTSYEYVVRAVARDGSPVLQSTRLPLVAAKMGYGVRGVPSGSSLFGYKFAVCAGDQAMYVGAPLVDGAKGAVSVFVTGPRKRVHLL